MTQKFMGFFLWAILCYTVAAVDIEDVRNANDYIDKVLESLRKDPGITKHLDPLDIPGEVSDIKFKLRNIQVRGLSNLYRQGDCSLSVINEAIHLVAEIAVRDVRATADYSANALFFWIHGNTLLTVDHAAVRLELTRTDGNARVNSLQVLNLGPYRISKINGPEIQKISEINEELASLLPRVIHLLSASPEIQKISEINEELKKKLDSLLPRVIHLFSASTEIQKISEINEEFKKKLESLLPRRLAALEECQKKLTRDRKRYRRDELINNLSEQNLIIEEAIDNWRRKNMTPVPTISRFLKHLG